ncbi:hypothetical protein FQN60_005569 [Etheostoma spectabile]|uniref:Uncharacterized protein n=1 Tax=Etheostoma spectabile TaxID=54343 RepID=A0A5J5CDL0_9PERO|nr:hypothetical protein FQN60_005569 [Etheostoma spectabile]
MVLHIRHFSAYLSVHLHYSAPFTPPTQILIVWGGGLIRALEQSAAGRNNIQVEASEVTEARRAPQICGSNILIAGKKPAIRVYPFG